MLEEPVYGRTARVGPWRLLACVFCFAAMAGVSPSAEYRIPEPGYEFQFPRDHFNHPEFRTEWWYYTGNLFTASGRRFGFELTFFRQAVARNGDRGTWSLNDIYLAHLALSDFENGEFHHRERLNRAGPGLAGASLDQLRLWNGNWQVLWGGGQRQELRAITERLDLRLTLDPEKDPVIHGIDGVCRKGAGEGVASHYISLTRIAARGTLLLDGEEFELEGPAWMDHEFFSHELGQERAGWDWFSVQLEDGSELMLYRLRRKDGSADPLSNGTFVDRNGAARRLTWSEFSMEPGETWEGYPIEWRLRVPSLGLDLKATTGMAGQEMVIDSRIVPTYWEGAMDFEGVRSGDSVRGVGYLEMTGYREPLSSGQ